MSEPRRRQPWWLYGILMSVIGGLVLLAQLGIKAERIDGSSMEPTLPVGSVIILYPAKTLEIGDIVSFREPKTGHIVTHSFVGYAKDGSLMTKGDANPTPDVHDPLLQKHDVIGVVWRHIDVFTLSFWTTLRGILTLVAIALLLVVSCCETAPRKEPKTQVPDKESPPV